jgi:hypothetical protein
MEIRIHIQEKDFGRSLFDDPDRFISTGGYLQLEVGLVGKD